MSHPDDCLAAVFVSPGRRIELSRFPIPALRAGEALVQITCSTLCGSDLYTLQGRRQETTPSILGHEAIGHVIALGDPAPLDCQGKELLVGDRITWSVATSCRQCDRCRRGWPQKCRKVFKYGHALAAGRTALSGGFAEYILLQAGSAIIPLPDELPDEVACPANCATATVAACFRNTEGVAERRVLVIGAGMLGLTATAFAKSQGASSITVIDRDETRVEQSLQFGATEAIASTASAEFLREAATPPFDSRFDVIFELSGAAECVQAAFAMGDVGCHIVLAGSVLPTVSVPMDPQAVVRKCLTVRGVHNYAPRDLVTAVAFLKSGAAFPFGERIGNRFRLREINEAVEYALAERPIRTAIGPGT